MDSRERQELIEAALQVRSRAYAPYSQFAVGAAVCDAEGRVFVGCNVENASYGLTLCAERAAVAAAVASGSTQLVAAAVAGRSAPAPCGACRQFLAEFGPAMEITMVDADEPSVVRRATLAELLPQQFRFDAP